MINSNLGLISHHLATIYPWQRGRRADEWLNCYLRTLD